ncbi:hypothetical protein Sjap_012729 [Stephania japonica]|uniref:Uncharacterized protein n=1 Tax=Stephania japonica TaxID=461633 RepID=A0AAP0NX26_9MAGN
MADEEIVGGFADLGEVVDIGVFGEGVAEVGRGGSLEKKRRCGFVCVVVGMAMADQKGPSDDSGTSSTRAVSIDEFQTLTQRVASQER